MSGAMHRVLVVDDEDDVRRSLARLVRRTGHEASEASSAAEALEVLRAQPHSLALCDVKLVGESGLDLMAVIVRDHPDTACVMVTAVDDPELARHALEMGAYGYVIKPFARNEIVINIANALRRRDLEVRQRRQTEELEATVRERTESLRKSLEILREVDAQRRRLLEHLVHAQEEERARIAGDIHDDSIQVMIAAGMRLEMLKRTLDAPEQEEPIAKLEASVRLCVQRLRRLIFDLRPRALDREGVGSALDLYLENVRKETGIEYGLNDTLGMHAKGDTATILYRVAQEALMNVRKHARATRVDVTLERTDDGCRLIVSDNGVGFEAAERTTRPGHLGLASMQERAELAGGACRIDATPGRGTQVIVTLPQPNPAEG